MDGKNVFVCKKKAELWSDGEAKRRLSSRNTISKNDPVVWENQNDWQGQEMYG